MVSFGGGVTSVGWIGASMLIFLTGACLNHSPIQLWALRLLLPRLGDPNAFRSHWLKSVMVFQAEAPPIRNTLIEPSQGCQTQSDYVRKI